jgi:hypothetical protein
VPYGYYKHSSDTLTSGGLGGGGGTVVGLLDGKFIDTTWDFTGCGYYWADECQTRIGYFVDKTVALDVLSESQAYFTGRDTSTDVRKYAIGYILPYQKQLQEKMGALLAGDYNSLAPTITVTSGAGGVSTATVNLNSWASNSAGAASANLIDPSGGFTLQLYAGVYGLSGFPSTFNQSFIDTTQIFVIGNGEASVPDTTVVAQGTQTPGQTVGEGGGAQWFIFTDTGSGKQYAAHSTPQVKNVSTDPTGYRNDTGVRMLETWFALQQQRDTACGGPYPADNGSATCAAKNTAVVNWKQNVDVMRSLHNAYGYGVYKTDAPFWY